jgi:hypothetical protein
MATLRKRSKGYWRARVRKSKQTIIHKADAEKWTKQIEVELFKGGFIKQGLAECTIFKETIERFISIFNRPL